MRSSFVSLRQSVICSFLLLTVFGTYSADDSDSRIPILDEHGREIIPNGFVVVTEDPKGAVYYAPEDYQRMVRMGANFQVIRVTLGQVGGWPGRKVNPDYMQQIDSIVKMGNDAGLKTILKMVVYDLRPFGKKGWDAIWNNTDGSQDALLNGWKRLWLRYKDEPSVFGYDLLNEPQRGFEPDEARCAREHMFPTVRRLADAMHEISPEKWALFQPLYRETGTGEGPFQEIKEPFGCERSIYAPHLYAMDKEKMQRMLSKYLREAKLCGVPLMLGEWGPATDVDADTNPEKQKRYTYMYKITANAIDHARIGAIKAWFSGTRVPLTSKLRPPFTWSIFSDPVAVGHVERKYITDSIARPRPLAVAGRIHRYDYDVDSNILNVTVKADAELGSTELYVPAERFYPHGFRITFGPDLELALKPGNRELDIMKAGVNNSKQGQLIFWDADSQRVIVKRWISSVPVLAIEVSAL